MISVLKFIARILMMTLSLATLSSYAASGTKNAEAKATNKSDTAITTQVWYDGDRIRTSWMSSRLVAEFNPKGNTSAIKSLDPSATERAHAQSRHVKIWETQRDAHKLMAQTKATNPNAQLSPIFYDSPAPGGRMRALPGNVIVTLDPNFTPAQVDAWTKQNGVEIVRILAFAQNTLLIRTEAGLAALDVAKRLRGAAGVVSVSPEWWQEVSTR